MQQLAQFFDAYAESELSDAECQALSAWLRASDAHVDDFVRESFLHSQLLVLFGQKALHAGVMTAPQCPVGTHASLDDASMSGLAARHRREQGIGRRPIWALAASLALVGVGLLWSWTRPSAVGQLTLVTADATWHAPSDAPSVGALLHEGDNFYLSRGKTLATLVSGAKVVIEGPAKFHFGGENEIRVEFGRLAATVPPQAAGFAIDSPLGKFVDLGTEFTLDIDAEGNARLYVFAGLVDVQPSRGPSFKVPQSRAVAYDGATGNVEPLEFGEEQRLVF